MKLSSLTPVPPTAYIDSAVTFSGLTLTGLTASRLVGTDTGKKLASIAPASPLSLGVSSLSLVNDNAGVITEIDTGGLANSDLVVPTSKAVKAALVALGAMDYPDAGIPVSTGIAWDTVIANDVSNARKFLRELSVAGVFTTPVWDTLLAADVPTLNQDTTGRAANADNADNATNAAAAAAAANLVFGSDAQDDVAVRGASVYGRLSLTEQTLLGRITGGHAAALSAAQVKTLLAIAQADVAGLLTSSSPTFAGATIGSLAGIIKGTAGVLSAIDLVDWTTPSFSAGDFTAAGSMTWTVEVGDVISYRYCIIGKLMFLFFALSGTALGGTPNLAIYIKIPASKSLANMVLSTSVYFGAALIAGYIYGSGSNTTLQLSKWDNSNFGSGSLTLYGQIFFEIN